MGVGKGRAVGELHELPVDLEGVVELEAVEGDLVLLIVLLEEGVGKLAPKVFDVLAGLLPPLISGLLEVLAVDVRFHALRKLAVHAGRVSLPS